MNRITAYTILKRLGNVTLRQYICERIPNQEFNSHDFTNSFPQHFKDEYATMLDAHANEGDTKARNIKIANAMGRYLGNNQRSFLIEKIGETASANMNGEKSRTSLWRKL